MNAGRKVAIAATLLALAACGREPLHGVVQTKTHEPSRTVTSTSLVCGKTCTPVVTTTYVPECYGVVVQGDNGEVSSGCIDEDIWVALREGDRFDEEES